jgi:hypothetical protein
LLLTACATALQPDNYVAHITSTRLGSDRFLVAYRGAAGNSDRATIDLTLLRSAEITLQHGFHYFIVVDSADPDAPIDITPQVGADDATLYDGERYHLASPGASNTIVCFRQKPQGFAYVALFVKASLRSKYDLDRVAEPA